MAHGITSVMVNGRSRIEALYAGKPAWHNLGKVWVSEDGQGPDSTQTIDGSGLGWEVGKEQACVRLNGTTVDIPDRFCTYRMDNHQPLGIVGSRYTVVQNRDCFRFLDSLVAEGHMQYESAFALYGGKQVAVLARLPGYDEIAEDDTSIRHILMLNSHDGSSEIQLVPTSTRVVCANTVAAALEENANLIWSIRHTASVDAQLRTAKKYLAQFSALFSGYVEGARELVTAQVSQKDRTRYLEHLFPRPRSVDGKEPSDKVLFNHAERIDHIETLFLRGKRNTLPAIKGSWWAMFNAVTEYLDHHTIFRGSHADSNRVTSLLYGAHASTKREAFRVAMEMSA